MFNVRVFEGSFRQVVLEASYNFPSKTFTENPPTSPYDSFSKLRAYFEEDRPPIRKYFVYEGDIYKYNEIT